ncbi:MAG: head GIN domain-containing protein [Prevotellaceae bacterium]|nr:head GIN domain-containing protein [Prevotellaceae bacterium]
MMKTKSIIAVALCSICLSSFANGSNDPMPEPVPAMATPKPVTVERNCSTFVSIDNRSPCNVFYKQGETFRVSIVAQEEHIDKIKTTVVDGMLVIEMEENTFIQKVKDVKINVESPSLTHVEISSSGSVTSQNPINVSGKPVTMSVKGSGNIKLKKLECSELGVNVTGSGNAEIGDVKAKTSEVEVRGSGNVEYSGMKISDKINLTVYGSGNISVSGTVDEVKTTIHGSGGVSGRVNCDHVSAVIKGSGDVKFSGNVKSHDTVVTGSGRVTIK